MKKILPEYNFTDEDLAKVSVLAAKSGLMEETVKIMYGRGIQTEEQMRRFLKPSRENFVSPFAMSGMKEAVDLITEARDNEWCVVIYGDYDADGIDATTIMANALLDFGIEPVLFIPERADGYGLSIDNIDRIFEEYCPELIITVDCGISAYDEIEYIKECGALVICTDHHELPERTPDCICVNPKFEDSYPYDNLCGAGVAFKVACALNGDEMGYKYLDFAAIATVADSVPLTGENRDIVAEGLKLMNESPRPCYSLLVKMGDDSMTSQTISFYLAPRINASGRMGHAREALQLFNARDPDETEKLAKRVLKYNDDRQKYTEQVEKEANDLLAQKERIGKCILLCGTDWSPGFVGVVAARIAESYSRPVILFTRSGNLMRGSARSVGNINIFEAIKACSQYFEEFGGHSMAAGVCIKAENLAPLEKTLDEYLSANYTEEDFASVVHVCDGVPEGEEERFAKEIQLLEPFGMGNKNPTFHRTEKTVKVGSVKADSKHLPFKTNSFEYMYFNGGRFQTLFASPATKDIYYEYDISRFRGREQIKGLVRDIVYDGRSEAAASGTIAMNSLKILSLPDVKCKIRYISEAELENIASDCDDFGTVFIASDLKSVERFNCLNRFSAELFTPTEKSSVSVILVSPVDDTDFSGYKTVVCLDDTHGITLPGLAGREVYVVKDARPDYLMQLSCVREDMLKDFSAIRREAFKVYASNAFDATDYIDSVAKLQAAFDILVFDQIGLSAFKGNDLIFIKGAKSALTNSPLYNKVASIQGRT